MLTGMASRILHVARFFAALRMTEERATRIRGGRDHHCPFEERGDEESRSHSVQEDLSLTGGSA